jgi:hypothetical protein
MGARHNLNRIKLHKPQPRDESRHIKRASGRCGKALRGKPKPPRSAVGNFQERHRKTRC